MAMKPHVRRGKAAKKARQDRAKARLNSKPVEGILPENSIPEWARYEPRVQGP